MEIIHSSYIISSPSVEQCPPADRPEYAFIGRSNVGKSSIINALCNKKEVAKVSSTPGKTQLINHFNIVTNDKDEWYIVDLPGYGFAKVSQSQRKNWQKMIQDYLKKRVTLTTIFILIDSRLKPQKLDIDFVNKLGEWEIPFALVFTKSDKETQREVANNVKVFLKQLGEFWEELPPHFVTSAVKRTGIKQMLQYISEQNEVFKEYKKKME